ncbi:hypothetical protein cyc_04353 [Cyclospora cayetanensis]|uniref:RNA helicase aquarius N-terminal domain-containing protein n=1 Tax=Cyclospora cayetanensis TaxID=88456 RepID=A0A1D3D1K5_9EIME|nr:hypothetical protein cyc_04353 [Cyclospora cayetanensis]
MPQQMALPHSQQQSAPIRFGVIRQQKLRLCLLLHLLLRRDAQERAFLLVSSPKELDVQRLRCLYTADIQDLQAQSQPILHLAFVFAYPAHIRMPPAKKNAGAGCLDSGQLVSRSELAHAEALKKALDQKLPREASDPQQQKELTRQQQQRALEAAEKRAASARAAAAAAEAAKASWEAHCASASHSQADLAQAGGEKGVAALVAEVYGHLRRSGFGGSALQALEHTHYLEAFLWPSFCSTPPAATAKGQEASGTTQPAHLLSICALLLGSGARGGEMLLPLYRQPRQLRALRQIAGPAVVANGSNSRGSNLASALSSREDGQAYSSTTKTQLSLGSCVIYLTHDEQRLLVSFFISAFYGLEHPVLRRLCLSSPRDREHLQQILLDRDFMFVLMRKFVVLSEDVAGSFSQDAVPLPLVLLLERMLEFFVDLLTQLPTRRCLLPLLQQQQLSVRAERSAAAACSEAGVLRQLLQQLFFYERFEIDDDTGRPLSAAACTARHYDRVEAFQRRCFELGGENCSGNGRSGHSGAADGSKAPLACAALADAALEPISSIDDWKRLQELLQQQELLTLLDLRKRSKSWVRQHLVAVLVRALQRQKDQLQQINSQPLYPDELELWDEVLLPQQQLHHSRQLQQARALPKLNLQFLTVHDYLLRNFKLFR